MSPYMSYKDMKLTKCLKFQLSLIAFLKQNVVLMCWELQRYEINLLFTILKELLELFLCL